MKVIKVLSRIMQIAAAVMFTASVVLCAITNDGADIIFMNLILSQAGLVLCAVVGAFLSFSNNEIAKKVGYGMSLTAYIIGLTLSLINLDNSAGAIVMLIAAIFIALHYVFKLVAFLMNRGSAEIISPNEDIRIIRIKEWKQILEAGIITSEEFEEKREQILGIKNKDKKPETNKLDMNK